MKSDIHLVVVPPLPPLPTSAARPRKVRDLSEVAPDVFGLDRVRHSQEFSYQSKTLIMQLLDPNTHILQVLGPTPTPPPIPL